MNEETKQIPQALPQFTDSSALIVAAGAYSAHLYYAQNGFVKEIDKAESDFFFDEREGFFVSNHPTLGSIGTGAPDMVNQAKERDRFQAKLAKEINHVVRKQDIAHLYIFSPKETASGLVDQLENDVQERLEHVEPRNLQFENPIKLLEVIEKN